MATAEGGMSLQEISKGTMIGVNVPRQDRVDSRRVSCDVIPSSHDEGCDPPVIF